MEIHQFLNTARRKWLSKFFQHAALVLLAGVAGGDLFLKVALKWRLAVVGAFVVNSLLGLMCAVEATNRKEED